MNFQDLFQPYLLDEPSTILEYPEHGFQMTFTKQDATTAFTPHDVVTRLLFSVCSGERYIATGYILLDTSYHFEFRRFTYIISQVSLIQSIEDHLNAIFAVRGTSPRSALLDMFYVDHPSVLVQITKCQDTQEAEYYYGSDTICQIVQRIENNLRGPLQGFFRALSTTFHFDLRSLEDVFSENIIQGTICSGATCILFHPVYFQAAITNQQPMVVFSIPHLNKFYREILLGIRHGFSGHLLLGRDQVVKFTLGNLEYRQKDETFVYAVTQEETNIYYDPYGTSVMQAVPSNTVLPVLPSQNSANILSKFGEIVGYISRHSLRDIRKDQFRKTTRVTRLYQDVNGKILIGEIPALSRVVYLGNSPNTTYAYLHLEGRGQTIATCQRSCLTTC
ncbi:hypothetical protein K493DRAFT_302778 [Basidiobolus meristosporus CBS 931.73]|uniref:Uncharacterized protein n=1 Tax=Basidiobolus meristosporus CBS 931.73 TaxID=1314790 RepID=A0A1Y1Y5M4_9FUNG|nr:hypothetical protein K493DRAFT_302778 [Basidiobolus meristosporus CBS 931.73]|eukprot:ORX93278.1 hypothetical protein K493DRAFT_302778 [Basidiobolus meristosporus CBS 931.73]